MNTSNRSPARSRQSRCRRIRTRGRATASSAGAGISAESLSYHWIKRSAERASLPQTAGTPIDSGKVNDGFGITVLDGPPACFRTLFVQSSHRLALLGPGLITVCRRDAKVHR
jgi:hypothetical protein